VIPCVVIDIIPVGFGMVVVAIIVFDGIKWFGALLLPTHQRLQAVDS